MFSIERLTVTRASFFSTAVCLVTAILGGCFAQAPPRFDSSRAFGILHKQCDFGPRPVGSKAHEQTCEYLYSQLKPLADSVSLQKFSHVRDGRTYQLTNITAKFEGDKKQAGVLLCAHWDTRPTAEQELEAEHRAKPILGANDGASGVAVLIELAHMFHERRPDIPVTIVLFDGEDFGPSGDHMFLGSRHFASTIRDETSRFRYGILLDMVGDKELTICREQLSENAGKEINDKIWETAKKLGYGKVFKDEVKYRISDDHLPLIEAGIPCVDIIDFDYAYWHTLEDTVDKCSPESLAAVGETIARVIYLERP